MQQAVDQSLDGDAVAANMTVTIKVLADQGSTSTTIATINSTNYSASERNIITRSVACGKHDFYLDLGWSGTALLTLGLPITIRGEYLDE